MTPEPFMAVGLHYDRFDQVSDEEVIAYLKRAAAHLEAER
jgi:predicted phosphoribosyltransferase